MLSLLDRLKTIVKNSPTIQILIMINIVVWCCFGLLKGLAWIATFLMGVA